MNKNCCLMIIREDPSLNNPRYSSFTLRGGGDGLNLYIVRPKLTIFITPHNYIPLKMQQFYLFPKVKVNAQWGG